MIDTRESRHFTIEYHENETDCIDDAVRLLEERYAAITEKLGKTRTQKTAVKICSDKAELDLALGIEDAPDWIRGGLASGKIVIASPLNPPPGSDYYNVINTAVHEFVHILLSEIHTKLPRWLDDGIASYEGRDNNEEWIKSTVRAGLDRGVVPAAAELDTGEDYEKFFELNGYQYSFTIIEFIISQYGYQRLTELVKAPEKLEEIFQITEEAFHDRWIRFLKDNY